MRVGRLLLVLFLLVNIPAKSALIQVEPEYMGAAKWITAPWSTERDGAEIDGSKPMPVFRHAFTVHGRVTHAELRIAGLGQFQARIGWAKNMRLVGPRGLHQAWTDYRKTVTFETYDVTPMMAAGEHVLAVALGNGMYNVQKTAKRYTKFDGSFGAPKMIAELRITYADGKSETIATDEHWKVTKGPTTFASTYGGEDFDARNEAAGWDSIGFNDSGWSNAALVDGPGGKLTPAIALEVVQTSSFKPPVTSNLNGGGVVYDFGQNAAGIVNLQVKGPAGSVLKLTPGELLKPDGSVSQNSSGVGMWWTYTLAGRPEGEGWEPQFGYYGFRYVQAEWVKDHGDIRSLTGISLSSASPQAGTFESSNEMLNSIHKLIVNAMHNNEVSLFTDCPHREKLGWLEETHLVAPGLIYNNDVRLLFAATDRNMADAQLEDGDVPTIAPQYTKFGPKYPIYDDSPEWGSASVLAAWKAYTFYGDKGELAKSYPTMQRYVAFLEGKAVDGIVAYGLGDWYDIGPGGPGVSKLTTTGVTGTLMLYEDAVDMEKIATLLGKPDDAAKYHALAAKEKAAFNAKFYDPAKGFYDKGSQTAQAMPLALGIVPDDAKAKVLAKLVDDIHAHNDHTTSGEVGFPYELRALMQNGHSDVLMAMLLRKDEPSYGSQLAAGATSLTESWNAKSGSRDHFMLGGAEEFFYRGLAGIDVDMSRKPDEQITIRPEVNQAIDGLKWVKASYKSALGTIESSWQEDHAIVTVTVVVPSGTKAAVLLPGAVETNGNHKVIGKGTLTGGSGLTSFLVGPGRHTFEVTVLQL